LRERHLAQRGHLAAAHFVQDLAGLGVASGSVVLAWKKASRRSTPWQCADRPTASAAR